MSFTCEFYQFRIPGKHNSSNETGHWPMGKEPLFGPFIEVKDFKAVTKIIIVVGHVSLGI